MDLLALYQAKEHMVMGLLETCMEGLYVVEAQDTARLAEEVVTR